MTPTVIEMVLFRVRPGTTDKVLLSDAEKATEYLQGCVGFIRRRLAEDGNGGWLDHIEWRSMDVAQNAAAEFEDGPLTDAFLAAIDPELVTVRHLTVR